MDTYKNRILTFDNDVIYQISNIVDGNIDDLKSKINVFLSNPKDLLVILDSSIHNDNFKYNLQDMNFDKMNFDKMKFNKITVYQTDNELTNPLLLSSLIRINVNIIEFHNCHFNALIFCVIDKIHNNRDIIRFINCKINNTTITNNLTRYEIIDCQLNNCCLDIVSSKIQNNTISLSSIKLINDDSTFINNKVIDSDTLIGYNTFNDVPKSYRSKRHEHIEYLFECIIDYNNISTYLINNLLLLTNVFTNSFYHNMQICITDKCYFFMNRYGKLRYSKFLQNIENNNNEYNMNTIMMLINRIINKYNTILVGEFVHNSFVDCNINESVILTIAMVEKCDINNIMYEFGDFGLEIDEPWILLNEDSFEEHAFSIKDKNNYHSITIINGITDIQKFIYKNNNRILFYNNNYYGTISKLLELISEN